MVRQGKPEEEKLWSVPSGQREQGETFEQCCVREAEEETEYKAELLRPLHIKRGDYIVEHEVHYFEVRILSGNSIIQDPDNLIYEIAWKSAEEIRELPLSFEEDREFLLQFINGRKQESEF